MQVQESICKIRTQLHVLQDLPDQKITPRKNFLNKFRFIQLQHKCNKIDSLCICILTNIRSCNHHHNWDGEYWHHPQKLCAYLQSVLSPPLQPVAKIYVFYVLRLLSFMKCHIPLCFQKYILKESSISKTLQSLLTTIAFYHRNL